ncbi:MAG TPA: glycosyltransferase family 2 protein [Cyclobacteriaceae bacterium]|nr:glycosyltransferase family 2 protein [Cyclobacteriaceae bacterium]
MDDALKNYNYEIVFVDDGSMDRSVDKINDCGDSRVKVIVLNKNYGQTTALAAGIDHSDGDVIVTLDGDLQNDPHDIPAMLKIMEEGNWDVVAGRRAIRKDSFFLKKLPSRVANYLIRKISGVYINDYGCTLKVFRASVAKNLGLYGELHRFIPILAQLQGASITEMNVIHHPRISGKTKYGFGRTFRVVSDLLLMVFFQKYLQRPMHLFGSLGIFPFGLGIILDIYLLVVKIMGQDIWGRPLLILAITLTLGGIQLITSGLIAEIIMRTYYESQNKKTYRIKDIFIGKKQS